MENLKDSPFFYYRTININHIYNQGGMPLDEIIYTGQITEEELKKELNKLLNQFLRELNDKKEGAQKA